MKEFMKDSSMFSLRLFICQARRILERIKKFFIIFSNNIFPYVNKFVFELFKRRVVESHVFFFFFFWKCFSQPYSRCVSARNAREEERRLRFRPHHESHHISRFASEIRRGGEFREGKERKREKAGPPGV